MNRVLTVVVLIAAVAVSALAQPVEAPEINPASASAALSVLAGAALIIRSRARR